MNLPTIDPKKQEAQDLILRGKLGAATKLLKKLCKSNKYDDGAWLMLGDLYGQQGKIHEAIKCFKKSIDANPGNAQAHFMLGFSLQHCGKHADAIKAYQSAINVEPYYADARNNLSTALLMLNKFEGALEVCLDALSHNPDDVFALINAGKSSYGLDDLIYAEKYYADALNIESDNYEAVSGLADIFERQGQLDKAIEYYRNAAALRPDLPQSYNNLALLFFNNENIDEAIECCEQALKIDENYAPALINLGVSYQGKGMLSKARQVYESLLLIEPNNFGGLYGMARVLSDEGRFSQARKYYKAASRVNPDSIDSAEGEIKMLVEMGESEHAYKRLEPYEQLRESNPNIALIYSKLANTDIQIKDSIQNLENLLTRKIDSIRGQSDIHFQLGNLYDQLSMFGKAFGHYKNANDLRNEKFSCQVFNDRIEKVISQFNNKHLSGLPKANNESELPIFIVGMPRSGKTLVEQMLASHSQVVGMGELTNISEMVHQLEKKHEKPLELLIDELSVEELDDIADSYLSLLHAEGFKGSERVIDTMPANLELLGFITMLFPRARVIHCVRDPKDMLLECYFSNFVKGRQKYTYNFENLYCRYKSHERLYLHWLNTLELSQLVVNFEKLVQNPEMEIRRIIGFMDLKWDSRCLEFYKPGKPNLIGYPSFREPLSKNFVGRWRKYEDHIQPLLDLLT